MRILTLFLFFIATMPLQLPAQSRWNNYFVAHFMTADITPLSTVDSLAAANDWHRTYHTPMIGHTEVIYDYPYMTTNISSPLAPLIYTDSILEAGRFIGLGDGNGGLESAILEEVVYEPNWSPDLCWQYFQLLATECLDADYYQVRLPTTETILDAIEIIKSRPFFSTENWYFNFDGYAVVTEPCMEFGYNVPSGPCSNSESRSAATQATEYMAGFIQNISGIPWFPFVLSMNSQTSNWDWPGCSSSFGSIYELGEMSPSTGCIPPLNGQLQYWACDTVYVACPDLDNNNLIGIGDIMDVLSVYGNPYDCADQE